MVDAQLSEERDRGVCRSVGTVATLAGLGFDGAVRPVDRSQMYLNEAGDLGGSPGIDGEEEELGNHER